MTPPWVVSIIITIIVLVVVVILPVGGGGDSKPFGTCISKYFVVFVFLCVG